MLSNSEFVLFLSDLYIWKGTEFTNEFISWCRKSGYIPELLFREKLHELYLQFSPRYIHVVENTHEIE